MVAKFHSKSKVFYTSINTLIHYKRTVKAAVISDDLSMVPEKIDDHSMI